MTTGPLDRNPLDPEDILRRLPHNERDRFIREYRSALDAAHELCRYRQLQELLRLWHLRAVAYAQPDFKERAEQVRSGAGGDSTPVEEITPGWSERAGGAS